MDDRDFMRIAVEEARKSIGEEDDPKVGAVLVRNGTELARSHRYRDATKGNSAVHAEYELLTQSGNKARDATLYTTLEPCTKRQGMTFACADFIIKHYIKRVLIGILDPNPDIRGQGLWALQDRGIDIGLFDRELVDEIKAINKSFIDYQQGLALHITWPTGNAQITKRNCEVEGTSRVRVRAGDPIVALVRQKDTNTYYPQGRVSFQRDLTWKCGVALGALTEYEIIIARIEGDLSILLTHYGRVHEKTGDWIGFEFPTPPSGIEVLASVSVRRKS
jgi:pyrimidine deaminase RibD-like protein